ncbi:MAG: 3-deoxy-D-manno-octulosonate 8-phosphate phosphatase [Coxiellaceae bacterium]|nr:3-deoxy-D-manno-octulosonate 8-phosphate phosphatase [Coxiellaceae bacterium]|tara:strand:+ start:3208 stop:3747 length:540 start_codon:yes stop_codon:yes gene_type:complete
MPFTQPLVNIAQRIRLLILDVDGVLTNGAVTLCSNGEDIKSFHSHDGHGIRAIQEAGIAVAIISGRTSQAVSLRMNELDVKQVYQGQKDKTLAFQELLEYYQLTPEEVAYMGDDIPDLAVMKQVSLPIAVANAVPAVKEGAVWQTVKTGGMGAVREACDCILQAQTQHDTHSKQEQHCD